MPAYNLISLWHVNHDASCIGIMGLKETVFMSISTGSSFRMGKTVSCVNNACNCDENKDLRQKCEEVELLSALELKNSLA